MLFSRLRVASLAVHLPGQRGGPLFPRMASSMSGQAASQGLPPRAAAVLDFWLGEGWATAPRMDARQDRSKIWFMGGPAVDEEIVEKFGGDCAALLEGRYVAWREAPLPALAGIIIGDQLSRNAYRGTAKMYAADGKCLEWAKHLLDSGAAQESLTPIQQVFAIMPLMHSEELSDQEQCVARFKALAEECEAQEPGGAMAKMAGMNHKYAVLHLDVVKQWGRFPHRNAILGRTSTPEEAAGLAAGTIAKF